MGIGKKGELAVGKGKARGFCRRGGGKKKGAKKKKRCMDREQLAGRTSGKGARTRRGGQVIGS